MDRQTDRWMDVRTDFPCILQDIVPFGSAAQKGKEENENEKKVGKKKKRKKGKEEKDQMEREAIYKRRKIDVSIAMY